MPRLALFALLFATPLLGGCLAKAAIGVADRAGSGCQSGGGLGDHQPGRSRPRRGREIRGREERSGSSSAGYDKQAEECREGNNAACRAAWKPSAKSMACWPGSG